MQSTSEDTRPASPHPLGPDAPTEDHVGLAVRSVAAAMAMACAWVALVIWGSVLLQGQQVAVSIDQVDPDAAYVNFLLYGVVAALPVTGFVAWRLMWPIDSSWRRGGLSMVGVLGGLSLAMVLTFVVRQTAGLIGLPIMAVLSLLAAAWFASSARRAASESFRSITE